MSELLVRAADEKDLVTIHALASKIWQNTYAPIISQQQIDYMFELMYSMEGLQQQIEVQKHRFFLVCETSTPIGFASISFPSISVCSIHKLYILPQMQGKQAGRTLLQAIENIAQTNQAQFLSLNVNRNNVKAIGFYEKVGFEIVETVDIPLSTYVLNDYVMQKKII